MAGRPNNICGTSPSNLRAQYLEYETAMVRGPRVLGGPMESGKGIAFDAGDITRCFRVYVRPAWFQKTFWLALQHADGHWSSWPCPMSWATVRETLERWDAFSNIRWAPEGTNEPLFDWPRIRHFGAKNFSPRNKVDFALKRCLGLVRQGTYFCLVDRSYMHTLNALNAPEGVGDGARLCHLDLLACRPFESLEQVAELSALLGPKLSKRFVPDTWCDADEREFLPQMATFFTSFTDELMKDGSIWPNLSGGKAKKKVQRAEERLDTQQAIERLRRENEALKAQLASSTRQERLVERNGSSFPPGGESLPNAPGPGFAPSLEDDGDEPAPEDEETLTSHEESVS